MSKTTGDSLGLDLLDYRMEEKTCRKERAILWDDLT